MVEWLANKYHIVVDLFGYSRTFIEDYYENGWKNIVENINETRPTEQKMGLIL